MSISARVRTAVDKAFKSAGDLVVSAELRSKAVSSFDFQLGETKDSVIFSEMFPQNSERLELQKKGPIRVIVGNPPYSVGQKDANDNAAHANVANANAAVTNAD